MKSVERKVMVMAMVLFSMAAFAQTKIDEQRMERDIEVAENILGTMMKQQFAKRSMFPINVTGSYRSGYGVTFIVPNFQSGIWFQNFDLPAPPLWPDAPSSFSYSHSDGETEEGITIIDGVVQDEDDRQIARDQKNQSVTIVGSGQRAPRVKKANRMNQDSLKQESSLKTINTIKEFLINYGDLIGQLTPTEKIIVTNKGEGDHLWFNQVGGRRGSAYISIEATKGDLAQFKQGKLTQDQLLSKLKVINSEIDNELKPDLELLASIFSRLYRSDLSRTYFTQEATYYERLKDYGVIYYMQVYSSNQREGDLWNMPTVSTEEIDQATRDKKVIEMYPLFVKGIKEDILEYGRTLKSLKDDENLILNIKLTRCVGCGIPSFVELSIKNSVLKDYSLGKLTKEAALEKIAEKKGPQQ
jgi:hypothetical protein